MRFQILGDERREEKSKKIAPSLLQTLDALLLSAGHSVLLQFAQRSLSILV